VRREVRIQLGEGRIEVGKPMENQAFPREEFMRNKAKKLLNRSIISSYKVDENYEFDIYCPHTIIEGFVFKQALRVSCYWLTKFNQLMK
jgi:hypothetical protein